jgi:Flp pilus assembly protein TadG
MLNRSLLRGVSRRKGAVVVLFALCLAGLLGVVAIAADGGVLQDEQRKVQAAADAAAFAAAVDLYEHYQTNSGLDPNNTARDSATNAASKMGYLTSDTRTTIAVNIPPTYGPNAGKKGYVEVLIQYNQLRYFSRIFGAADMPVRARAVARGRWTSFRNGILVLDLSVSEALKSNGGGTVSVANADIIVNSSDGSSVGGDGTGSVIKVINGEFDLTGGVKSNTTLDGPVNYNQDPTPDPLAYLPQPSLPLGVNTAKGLHSNNPDAKPYLDALNIQPKDVNGQVYILEPGRYDKMPNFTNGDVVILKQASADGSGIYYLNDSGFTSTGATIVMDPTGATTGGLMFYNDPGRNSAGISITGGKVVIDPLSSGIYAGISIFQRRDADIPLSITGQGGMSFSGTFYVAGGEIKITGSSSSALDVIGAQYISRTLQSGGNGNYTVDWQATKTARTRQLTIVE